MKKRLLLPFIIIVLFLMPVILYVIKESAKLDVPSIEASMYATEGDGTLYFINWDGNIQSFKNGKVNLVENNSAACYLDYDEGTLFYLNRSTREYISVGSDGTKKVLYTFENPVFCLFKSEERLYASAYPPFSYIRIDLTNKSYEKLASILLEPKYTSVCNGNIYWIDNEVIHRMGLDGSNPEKLVTGSSNCLIVADDTLYYNYRIDDALADPVNQIVSFDLITGKAKTVLEPPKGKTVRLIGAVDDTLLYYITSGYRSIDIYSYKGGKSRLIYGGFKYEPAVYNDNICTTEKYILIQTINVNPSAIDLTNKQHNSLNTRCYNYAISLVDGTLYLLDVSSIIMGFD